MTTEVTNIMLNQIKEIDARDESQILAELAGESVEEFVYEITDKKTKKRIVKLSWIGTREMARNRGNITLTDPIVEDVDGAVRIVVRATDLTRNFSVFGGCHQPKKQKVKLYDDEGKVAGFQEQDDDHYFTKGLSKAQRNALQSVIPANFMAKMINQFLLMSGREPLKQLPQPKAQPPRVSKNLPELTEKDIPDFLTLEKEIYNRYHIQPAQVYKNLGYNSRLDCLMTPWQCFCSLKEIFEKPKVR